MVLRRHIPFCHGAEQSCARLFGPVAKRYMIPSQVLLWARPSMRAKHHATPSTHPAAQFSSLIIPPPAPSPLPLPCRNIRASRRFGPVHSECKANKNHAGGCRARRRDRDLRFDAKTRQAEGWP
jgi:hypothetical protein